MKNIHTIGFLLLASSAIVGCNSKSADKQTQIEDLKKQREEINNKIADLEKELIEVDSSLTFGKATMVEIENIKLRPFKSFVNVQGNIDAQDNVTISPKSQGPIVGIYAKVGDRVSKGQILAEQESGPLKQSIAGLEAQYALAKTVFEKQKNLWEQKVGSEIQYLNSKAQKESMEKQLASLKEQLDLTKFRSPINGTVDAMDVKIGQSPNPMNSGIRVVNTSELKVKASFGEAFASRIHEGDPALIVLPDTKDTIATKVSFVAEVIDPITRSFNVEAKLPNNKKLKPNMVAVFKINDYSSNAAICVPVKTIQNLEDGDYLFISENKRAKKVKVKVGNIYNGTAQILSGLKEGDKLIVTGFQELVDGQALNY